MVVVGFCVAVVIVMALRKWIRLKEGYTVAMLQHIYEQDDAARTHALVRRKILLFEQRKCLPRPFVLPQWRPTQPYRYEAGTGVMVLEEHL